jgi:hypothetical protein
MNEVVNNTPMIHVFYDGQSHDVEMSMLDIGNQSSDQQIRDAVATHFSVPANKLRNFTVDRNAATGHMTLRPDAVFGSI